MVVAWGALRPSGQQSEVGASETIEPVRAVSVDGLAMSILC